VRMWLCWAFGIFDSWIRVILSFEVRWDVIDVMLSRSLRITFA